MYHAPRRPRVVGRTIAPEDAHAHLRLVVLRRSKGAPRGGNPLAQTTRPSSARNGGYDSRNLGASLQGARDGRPQRGVCRHLRLALRLFAKAGGAPRASRAHPECEGATPGETSITHYEYLHAVERGLPIIAFLLDEQYPWPPQLIDGFDATRAGAQPNADKIRALRLSLQQERVVSWFTTPADLEARVSAAVATARLASQLDLQPALLPVSQSGVASDSILEYGIAQAIIGVGDDQHALKIDLATTWWSTRLYLIASLAQRLSEARRIVVVDTRPLAAPSISGPSSTGTTLI